MTIPAKTKTLTSTTETTSSNSHRRHHLTAIVFVILVAIMIVSVITGIGFGSIQLSPSDVVKGLFGPSDFQWHRVVWGVRFPRVVLAALVGMNLATSGVILQAVMSNPLADPSIIGVGRRASRNRHAAYFPRTGKPCTCNGVHRCDVGSHGNLCTRMERWRSTTANHPFRGCRLSAVRRRDLRCHGTYGRQCARRSHVHEWQPRHAQLGRGVPHLAIYRGRDHCRRCAVPQTRHHHSG